MWLMWFAVGVAVGVALATWAERQDGGAGERESVGALERGSGAIGRRRVISRWNGMLVISNQPTVRYELHPAADEWPAWTRN